MPLGDFQDLRVGLGIDLHRLVAGRPCILGGVTVESPVGPQGHSDGDVIAHAVCDAVLGAAGMGDLGMLYPDTDARNQGKNSMQMLREVGIRVANEGWKFNNLDVVVEAQNLKIAPIRDKVIRGIANTLMIDVQRVNVRGKTGEGLESIGRGEAIRATAVALLIR